MENKKGFEAISAGISDGFKELGFELSERDKRIIHLTTVAAITIGDRLARGDYDDKE